MKKIIFLLTLVFACSVSLYSQENKGKFSGLMFADYFYNVQRDTGINSLSNSVFPGSKDMNGFQFRRIYFAYDYNISETFSSRFRLEADQLSNTSNGKIGVFVKDAYLKWNKIFSGSDLIFGIQPTPAFDISEGIYGHRYLEKTIMDLRGIVSSRDFAISLKGKINDSGTFTYWMMAGNNSGNSPESDKYKRLYAHLGIKLTPELTVTGYTDYRFRQQKTVKLSASSTALLNNDVITSALFIGYAKKEMFSIGIESFLQVNRNEIQITSGSGITSQNRNALGVSLFGTVDMNKQFALSARGDYFDNNMESTYKGDYRLVFIGSLDYKPHESVIISPNVLVETFESTTTRDITPSVTGRLTLFWTFL